MHSKEMRVWSWHAVLDFSLALCIDNIDRFLFQCLLKVVIGWWMCFCFEWKFIHIPMIQWWGSILNDFKVPCDGNVKDNKIIIKKKNYISCRGEVSIDNHLSLYVCIFITRLSLLHIDEVPATICRHCNLISQLKPTL